MIRFFINIPYKTHISNILKALGILNIEYLLYTQICILIKLLHRHVHTKSSLVSCLTDNYHKLDICKYIMEISDVLKKDKEQIIFYPDRTRKKLLEHYYYDNVDMNLMEEITEILQYYNFDNKKKLLNLIKV